jgi:hypothetical protein
MDICIISKYGFLKVIYLGYETLPNASYLFILSVFPLSDFIYFYLS